MSKQAKYSTEIIELVVKVKIQYYDEKGRKDAIQNAKWCVKNTSVLGMASAEPKSCILLKP